jgi:hypothetical protein
MIGLQAPSIGRAAGFLAGICLVAGLASAGPRTGSRIDSAPGSVESVESEDSDTALRVTNTFARCVARQHGRAAEAVVAMSYLSPDQSRAASRLVGGQEDCMGSSGASLSLKPPLLVGGMAEQFVLQRYRNADLAPLTGMTDEAQAAAGLVARNNAEDLSLCVIRRDPAAARALIETVPASKEEAAQIQRLLPHLGPCVPAGQSLTLNKPALRALFATGLYRALSLLAARPPATGAAQ